MNGRALLASLTLFPSVVSAQQAANAHYDPDTMEAARRALYKSHGGQTTSLVLLERLETHSDHEDSTLAWEGQAWLGGDVQKLWVKTDGEFLDERNRPEELELQLLYSHAIHSFWDFQIGARQNFRPRPSRSYAAIGLQGLAPQWLEVDAALFFSEQGKASARLETEYELLLTQRLILQPRIELNAALSDDRALHIGSGLNLADVELRLRYEFSRQFAPYIGVSWTRAFGETADWIRAEGAQDEHLSFVAGIRSWF